MDRSRFWGKYSLVAAALIFAGASLRAQVRQTHLYIDDGSGNFTILSAAPGGGTITFPASGTLATTANSLAHLVESYLTTGQYSVTNTGEQLLATDASATNISIALQPKGNGALEAQIADGTATGGNARGQYAVDWQTVRSSSVYIASGAGSVISGGQYNVASGAGSTVAGGTHNSSTQAYTTVGGGNTNTSGTQGATVAGGENNNAGGSDASIIGGWANNAGGGYSVVAGGVDNLANSTYAVVVGGTTDSAKNIGASVVGGSHNVASGQYSTAAGGQNNTGSGSYATVSGGYENYASAYASVGGGYVDTASNSYATVGGGGTNKASAQNSTVGGGYDNTASGSDALVGGGFLNSAIGAESVVVGGVHNRADSLYAVEVGGDLNDADSAYAIVVGGDNNTARGQHSFIGNGSFSQVSAPYATVGGGQRDWAGDTAATIAGGEWNRALGNFAAVGGGDYNYANGAYSAIPGGDSLTISGNHDFGFNAGLAMAVTASNTTVFGNTDLWLANNDGTARALYFYAPNSTSGTFPGSTKYVAFKAGAVATSVTYTLPTADGNANDVLSTDGSGNLSWATPSASLGAYAYVYDVNSVSGQTVSAGSDVAFSNNGPLSNISHTAGTSTLTVTNAGVYKIDYKLNVSSVTAGVPVGIAVNGTMDPSTETKFLLSTGEITGSCILSLAAGDVLTLRNNSGTNSFTTTTTPDAAAAITILQLQ